MKSRRYALLLGFCLGMVTLLRGAEVVEDDWEKEVKAEDAAAQADFATWKSTGNVPENFENHAIRGDRPDLVERIFSNDKLAETEIKAELPATACEVTIRDTAPFKSEMKKSGEYATVWRRITKDRFEIWTPVSGKLFDAKGNLRNEVKVHRGDGWGREWYGAFLPDGRWITTDIDELDKEVTAFSAKGKRLWVVKGAKLAPSTGKEMEEMSSLPLIAWARSDKTGKAWIVSVGSDRGRGYAKLTPDGKWQKIEDPWTACLPQQLRSRGMYTDRFTMSDDGKLMINRTEASHGIHVGWPHYNFNNTVIMIPNGDDFGFLPDAWSAFVEGDCGPLVTAAGESTKERMEERKDERVWLFDSKGVYQHWTKGRTVGASLASGGLWVRQLDDTCVLLEKGYTMKSRRSFSTKKQAALVPVELHDDIGLGMFLLDGKLVLGTWE